MLSERNSPKIPVDENRETQLEREKNYSIHDI